MVLPRSGGGGGSVSLVATERRPEEFTCPRCHTGKNEPCKDDWGRVRSQMDPHCYARVTLANKKTRELQRKLFGEPGE